MAAYEPLQIDDRGYHDEDGTKDPLLQDELNSIPHSKQPTSKWAQWGTVAVSLLSVLCAFALYLASMRVELPGPRSAKGLRQPDQYNTLNLTQELKKGPIVWFPGYIVRANKAAPDEVYTSGPHVVLDDNNSMFFQFRMPASKFTRCYIGSAVPTPEEGAAANKTYVSSGSLTEFKVWNVTTPSKPMKSLSWNTRPERVALMGTVAFLPEEEMIDQLDLEDGWQLSDPTPRFACGQKETYTIEVSCEGCSLEYEQILSLPALAFDLFQIG
ncbi:hypothetical protein SERLA73DRAFT_169425 [Serpula lacrymans var. lacrymans S7.3]|uniref:Ubiquitin 3 binding protein But2 C-terminal domain-containing protein n=2 Tax=Serpula lacrymans var. lacrymans TaxID=341189 RepID=F8PZZ3_SERL3|nr:uncharacterized protein SERLADRAFT_470699 [Serpula lacrymans var. lacrymans S7.9]EGN98465.1 hypothetical protein SERLA73DRAFT_169425 [Serpula lacrymans var. lacrymans S7.3]EGO24044.1 hypothetical protein SERLADRAFT_470699 [Serpula lacrymans var. lacrymans S7.9]